LVSRRVSTLVPGAQSLGERRLAARLHQDLLGTRHSWFWIEHSRCHAGALLGNARPLPRAALEWFGAGTVLRSFAHHGPQLPGPVDRGLRRGAAAALGRE